MSLAVMCWCGCYAIGQHNTATRKECDFSALHPLLIGSSDWLWRGGIVKRGEPIYPLEAKRKHLRGTIQVRVLIDDEGKVERACGAGQPLLRDAAEHAALQWIFNTPKLNGKAVAYIEQTIAFRFVLDDSKPPK
jgi:TonB family protein